MTRDWAIEEARRILHNWGLDTFCMSDTEVLRLFGNKWRGIRHEIDAVATSLHRDALTEASDVVEGISLWWKLLPDDLRDKRLGVSSVHSWPLYNAKTISVIMCNPSQLLSAIDDATQSVGSVKHYVVYPNTTANIKPRCDKEATIYSIRINKRAFLVVTTIHERI